MKDDKFRLKPKKEIDKLTIEQKARNFQDLMRKMKPRDAELEELNPGLMKRGREKKKPEIPGDSQGS